MSDFMHVISFAHVDVLCSYARTSARAVLTLLEENHLKYHKSEDIETFESSIPSTHLFQESLDVGGVQIKKYDHDAHKRFIAISKRNEWKWWHFRWLTPSGIFFGIHFDYVEGQIADKQ